MSMEPHSRIYKFSDPVSGQAVWRGSPKEWNGQRPSASQGLYTEGQMNDYADSARNLALAGCEPYLKCGQTPAERMKQDQDDILGLMKLLEKTKWALQDAVSTNAENCRQRDWWKHAHATVEAELTANERKVDALLAALEAAANALAWAERRMACPAYAEVIANDERNARAALTGDAA